MQTHCEHISPGSGIRRAGPGIAPIWHYHSEIELNLVIAGRGAYFLDNATYELSPGALVWMLPNQSHRLLPGPDLQMWVVTHASDRLDRSFLHDVAGHASRVLARDDALALDRLFTYVSQDADEPQLYRAGIDYALRSALHTSMSGPEAASAPLHPAVVHALQVLRNTPDIANAAELARRCGVTAAYLRELLGKQTGRGFVEWRNRYRLERFQLLYPESGDLLTAALEAGFGSYTQFHRVFLEIVGCTPGDWVTGGGNQANSPPIVDFAAAPDRTSNRMIWYALAGTVFEDSRRLIPPSFAARLSAADGLTGEHVPVPSHVIASYDQRRFESDLILALKSSDPVAGRHLQTACERFDMFAEHFNMLSLWNFGLGDISALIAVHILTAAMAGNKAPPPGRQAADLFVRRIGVALRESGAFQSSSTEEVQRATAAICLQSQLLRSAIVGALNAQSPDMFDAVSASARRTIHQTYGVDLASLSLPRPG